MGPFQVLREIANSRGLELIIIGGHAVNAHGYLRTTVDIDFMIPESELEDWKVGLSGYGYVWFHETDAFVQYRAPEGDDTYPIDVMIVANSTFAKVKAKAETKRFGESEHLVPRALEIIALKLHALKSPQRAAMGKDMPDILALAREKGYRLEDSEFRGILEQYADPETRAEVERQLGSGS